MRVESKRAKARGATWLLTELSPEDPDIGFGPCDLGMGEREPGYVSIVELKDIRGPGGLTTERDLYIRAEKTLSAWAGEAKAQGRISTIRQAPDNSSSIISFPSGL